ncbi:universal stress protein [Dasania marina]|uniref:universal stress protein n=1 Tax=Dasania marina TaxID=471499 RepID=UPI0030DB88F9|tara:strand:- start:31358 stop:32164 length:807 start_codon:yes stop_codon:yes gene_type:complete
MKSEVILVAVDPSRNFHPALERVIVNASLRKKKPRLHLFIAVDANASKLNLGNENLYPSLAVLNTLVQSVEAQGLICDTELYWAEHWQQGMLDAAKRIKADLIVMTDHSNVSRNVFLADSKWMLLRQAKRPVMLVRSGASGRRESILAAVNMQATDEDHKILNSRILAAGRLMAQQYRAEFHVVNAYQDSMRYPDRGLLVRAAEVDTANVHVKKGAPESVIAETAAALGADVVVIGTMARQGVMDSIRGHTSERVLNNLQFQDVLTIN